MPKDNIDELAGHSVYAFGIVLEAKVRALVQLIKKHQPECTLEQAKETVARWIEDEWNKSS